MIEGPTTRQIMDRLNEKEIEIAMIIGNIEVGIMGIIVIRITKITAVLPIIPIIMVTKQ